MPRMPSGCKPRRKPDWKKGSRLRSTLLNLLRRPRTHLVRRLRQAHLQNHVALTVLPDPLTVVIAEYAEIGEFDARRRETLSVLDVRTGKRRQLLSGDLGAPRAMAHNPKTGITYVAQERKSQVAGLKIGAGAQSTDFSVKADHPCGIAVDPDAGPAGVISVSEYASGRILKFDAATGQRLSFSPVGLPAAPRDMVLLPDPADPLKKRLYVADPNQGKIVVLDAATGATANVVIEGVVNPQRLAIDVEHRLLFVVGGLVSLHSPLSRSPGFQGAFHADTGKLVSLGFSEHSRYFRHDLEVARDIVYDPVDRAILVAGPDRLRPFWVGEDRLLIRPPRRPVASTRSGSRGGLPAAAPVRRIAGPYRDEIPSDGGTITMVTVPMTTDLQMAAFVEELATIHTVILGLNEQPAIFSHADCLWGSAYARHQVAMEYLRRHKQRASADALAGILGRRIEATAPAPRDGTPAGSTSSWPAGIGGLSSAGMEETPNSIGATVRELQAIGVMVFDTVEQATAAGEELLRHGVIPEVPYRLADERIVTESIMELAALAREHGNIPVAAGTIRELRQALAAMEAGASILVSPGAPDDLTKIWWAAQARQNGMTGKQAVLYVPGVGTLQEADAVLAAAKQEIGLTPDQITLKFFPALYQGPEGFMAEVLGPLRMTREAFDQRARVEYGSPSSDRPAATYTALARHMADPQGGMKTFVVPVAAGEWFDGRALIREIAERHPGVRLIPTSGRFTPEHVRWAGPGSHIDAIGMLIRANVDAAHADAAGIRAPRIANIRLRVPIRVQVMIVDDQALDRELLEEAVSAVAEASHMAVDIKTCSGVSAVRTALTAGQKPDVLFTDLNLLDGNGLQVAALVLENNPSARTVLVSAPLRDQPATIVDAVADGRITEFLNKSLPVDDLQRAVARALSDFIPAAGMEEPIVGSAKLEVPAHAVERYQAALAQLETVRSLRGDPGPRYAAARTYLLMGRVGHAIAPALQQLGVPHFAAVVESIAEARWLMVLGVETDHIVGILEPVQAGDYAQIGVQTVYSRALLTSLFELRTRLFPSILGNNHIVVTELDDVSRVERSLGQFDMFVPSAAVDAFVPSVQATQRFLDAMG